MIFPPLNAGVYEDGHFVDFGENFLLRVGQFTAIIILGSTIVFICCVNVKYRLEFR